MFDTKIEISGLENLEKIVTFLKKYEFDAKLSKFLKEKVQNILEKVMNERFGMSTTTNDEYIDLYKNSNHFVDTKDGFILYNDAQVVANTKNAELYPNGMFNIALAFEFGVGIVGEGSYINDKFTPWDYNLNEYETGWYYTKDGVSKFTSGYEGYEIYRYVSIEIENNILNWYGEFIKKEGL